MLPDTIIADIQFEISQIEKELSSYQSLFELVQKRDPDLIELTALGAVLHSFYTGFEKILYMVAKQIDKNIPGGYNWHKELLFSSSKENSQRKKIISSESYDLLLEYLSFRHFFRHAYDFNLKWSKLKNLIFNLRSIWGKLKKDILLFISD